MISTQRVGVSDRLLVDRSLRTRDTAALAAALMGKGYFGPPVGMGMSELKMSHWIFHVPLDFFEKFIHLPWSRWEPSAPMISYVPVP
jgi:hypothetical protein